MIDYHIHLEAGPFSMEWLEEFWNSGRNRGISEIGIAEHSHRFIQFRKIFHHLAVGQDSYQFMRDWMDQEFKHDLDEYVDFVLAARKKGIPVKLGLEVDYLLGQEEAIRTILGSYPFDYVIGSVHVIGKWGFDYDKDCGWEGRNIDTVYEEYYNLVKAAAQSRLFDIIGHLDVIKVFGARPSAENLELIKEVLNAIKDNGLAIEINTAGLRKPVGEIYPSEALLKEIAAIQIPITISSDAHRPDDVGYEWEKAVTLARKYGYREYRIFSGRKSTAEKLPRLSSD
ncbi:MAG: histidinol-phosphatase [Firmicutes bacterium]|nr:histidinol-phosphatase [Bacillota bacterium]